MNYILIKIIFGFCIVIFVNACHTFEHQNIFLEKIKSNLNQQKSDKENKGKEVGGNNISEIIDALNNFKKFLLTHLYYEF